MDYLQITEKYKHFLVCKVLQPEFPQTTIVEVVIEAVYSYQKRLIYWRELQDTRLWKQG
jgi:hypothetical protein